MRVGIDCRKIADFGIGTYVRGLVRALAELGGDEEYVLFVPSSLRTPLPFQHVVVDAPHYSARELWGMGRAIARAGLDLFHAPHFVLPWTSCPSIATIHDVILAHFPPPQPGGSLYYARMMRRALRKSVRVLTVSEAAKRSIVETFPCDPGKITVTPNGIEPIFFERGPAASDLGRYFLYVGNDKPHKNVGALVGAFHEVEGASLVLAGADFARYQGFPGILTPGFVSIERLAELYRGAIAVVVPSLEEGFGLPAAEAMACGTPVIASRIASLVEVAGDAALYVDVTPPADSAATAVRFAEAMNRMLREPALREELSARGRARAEPFTWRRCAELTREAYRSVLEA
jgi:glycosyltransferase involved in cell wall biosynthesis